MASTLPSPTQTSKDKDFNTLSPVVRVIVGAEKAQEIHYVHSSLLCSKSEYFRGCLQSNFSEAFTGEVSLPDVDPNAFRFVVKWMYTGDVAPFASSTHDEVVNWMIDLYQLADRLLCPDLKNRAVDMIQKCAETYSIKLCDVLKVIRAGHGESKLADYMTKQLSWQMCRQGYEEYTTKSGWLDFLLANGRTTTRLMEELKDMHIDGTDKLADNPARKEGCGFHEHPKCNGLMHGRPQCKRWQKREFGDVKLKSA